MQITRIRLKYLFEANSYLVETETGFYLIDTGIKKQQKQLEEAINKAGCNPGDLSLIILTHGHIDHVGNVVYLRDKYRAKVAMHEGDINMVTSGNIFTDSGDNLMIKLLTAAMKISGLGNFETFTPDILLKDNQSLEDYGLNLSVLHTPGHSKGSITLQTPRNELFCGDIFDGSIEKTTNLIDNQKQLDKSVEFIRSLEPETIYPGHGEPFKRV